MAKRKKNKKIRSTKHVGRSGPPIALEYYNIPFVLFHLDLENQGYQPPVHHSAARSFWNIVPPGDYDPQDAGPLVDQYRKTLENSLATQIKEHSIAYWLHAYRRVSPGPIGANDEEETVRLVRETLEAAIRKYGQFEPCSGIGISGKVPPSAIFKGLLMENRFQVLREQLGEHPQLVLTDFDTTSLRDLYELERLAYQLWRCGAAQRIIGKGAGIRVAPEFDGGFFDTRSDELAELVENYDSRQKVLSASASARSITL